MEAWTVERPLRDHIRPVELWDRELSGELLYRRVGSERVEALRREGLDESAIGERIGTDLGRALRVLRRERRFDRVRIDGGLSRLPGIAAAVMQMVDVPVSRGQGGPFAAEVGARRMLARQRIAGGTVLDLGQSSIEVSALASGTPRRTSVTRDLLAMPVARAEDPQPSWREQLDGFNALVRTAAELIARVALKRPTPPVLVLALPTEVARDGTPGACTYPGLRGRADFARCVLAQLAERLGARHRWRGRPGRVLVLNDAELVAHAVRPRGDETVLSITLGFGPGGAFVGRGLAARG